ncbi:unnamed protein product [Amoebophrya sp. A25]|nr:unnamed protein product [Amoebophrya sp. A25]|eukprot:GSA25T00024829001.1
MLRKHPIEQNLRPVVQLQESDQTLLQNQRPDHFSNLGTVNLCSKGDHSHMTTGSTANDATAMTMSCNDFVHDTLAASAGVLWPSSTTHLGRDWLQSTMAGTLTSSEKRMRRTLETPCVIF